MFKFQGFVISDWQGVDKITYPPHSDYPNSVLAAIQAGIDMVSCSNLRPRYVNGNFVRVVWFTFMILKLYVGLFLGHGSVQSHRVH